LPISYPRDFPEVPFQAQRCRFFREPLGSVSRNAAGRTTFQELVGGGLWEAAWTTKPLNEADAAKWRAWVLSLRGPSLTFKGYATRRCYPQAHPAGAGSFSATASVNGDLSELGAVGRL